MPSEAEARQTEVTLSLRCGDCGGGGTRKSISDGMFLSDPDDEKWSREPTR